MLTPEQINRLPKYAQRELARLAADIAHLHGRLAVGPEDSDTFVHAYDSPSTPLGEGVRIRFVVEKREDADGLRYFDAHLEGEALRVSAQDGGRASDFFVQPWAANVVYLRCEARRR